MSDGRTGSEMGAAGRAYVEKEYSLRRWFPVLLGVVERVAGLSSPAPR